MSPYECTLADFRAMAKTGWPYNRTRLMVAASELKELTRLPSPNQPEHDWIKGLGRCDKTATDYYGGQTNEWCSEFAADVYLTSAVVNTNTNLFDELLGVDTVDDFRTIFAERHSLSERPTVGWVNPGDYIAAVNGSGEHNSHSMMTLAVSDDAQTIYVVNGNYSFPINGVSHRCVTLARLTYFDGNGVLNTKFDAFGLINSW